MLRDLVKSIFGEIYEILFSSFNALRHATTLANKGEYMEEIKTMLGKHTFVLARK